LTSEVMADRALDNSDRSEGSGSAEIPGTVGTAVGLVGPTVMLGMTPVGSRVSDGSGGSSDETNDGMSGMRSDCETLSEVGIGIAPVIIGSPVSVGPKAVVIPTTIPPVGSDSGSSEGSTPVGRGISPVKPDGTVIERDGTRPVAAGISPVDPMGRLNGRDGMISVGVGSTPVDAIGRSRERDGNMPDAAGRSSVEEGMMKGPRIVVPTVGEGCPPDGADAVGDTIVSGTPPVGTASEVATGTNASIAEVAGSAGRIPVGPTKTESVGRTIGDGRTPVEPTTGKSVGRTMDDGRTPVGPTTGKSVGRTMDDGRTPVEPTTGKSVGRTMEDGRTPVDPTTGKSVGRMMDDGRTPVEPTTGKSVGRTIDDGRTPVEPTIGKSVGSTIEDGRTPVDPTTGKSVGRTMDDGRPPVEPTTGKSVGRTMDDGRTPVEPTIGKSVGSTIEDGRTPVGRPIIGISVGSMLSLVATTAEDDG
jgi:formylmethanofuran dehydrogenase subunit C